MYIMNLTTYLAYSIYSSTLIPYLPFKMPMSRIHGIFQRSGCTVLLPHHECAPEIPCTSILSTFIHFPFPSSLSIPHSPQAHSFLGKALSSLSVSGRRCFILYRYFGGKGFHLALATDQSQPLVEPPP